MLVAHTHTYIDKTGEKRKAGRGEKKGRCALQARGNCKHGDGADRKSVV